MVFLVDERVVVQRVLDGRVHGRAVAGLCLLDGDVRLLFAELRRFEREAFLLGLLEA